jgi:hypothetical protein
MNRGGTGLGVLLLPYLQKAPLNRSLSECVAGRARTAPRLSTYQISSRRGFEKADGRTGFLQDSIG